jgi:penicillin-binding protein 1B
MKRAVVLPRYSNTQEFQPPPGVTEAMVDSQTGQLADASCPTTVSEHFIAGSEPKQYCDQSGAAHAQSTPGSWLKNLFGKGADPAPQGAPPHPPGATSASQPPTSSEKPGQSNGDASNEESEKKKGFIDRIFGIFGSNKQPASSSKP